jgi:hypothetical protein
MLVINQEMLKLRGTGSGSYPGYLRMNLNPFR